MKLIVGLGNPGGDYRDTYHNIGFMAVDALAERAGAPDFALDKKCNAYLSDVTLFGQSVTLCKPNTYMNLSGDAVSKLARYFKIAPCDILVFYDDVDIPRGTVRARRGGSAGTHNGMRDIVAKLGTGEFSRVRIGIGFKPDYMLLADYVLSRISAGYMPIMEKACAAAVDFSEAWIKGEPWQTQTVSVE